MQHNSAKYCSRCAKVILDSDCKHDVGYLSDISGSGFRTVEEKHFYPLLIKVCKNVCSTVIWIYLKND